MLAVCGRTVTRAAVVVGFVSAAATSARAACDVDLGFNVNV
jgi:hypothetical protein